jgi:hypothetical protein
MTYKAYRDASSYPSMVAALIPDDGRDVEAEAKAIFGKAKYMQDTDGAGFEAHNAGRGILAAFLY